MKPKNKFQKRIVEASKKLSRITQEQIQWGYENAIEHIGRRTSRGQINCTRCGHIWQGHGELINTLLGCDCPNCQAKLKVVTTKKQTFSGSYY